MKAYSPFSYLRRRSYFCRLAIFLIAAYTGKATASATIESGNLSYESFNHGENVQSLTVINVINEDDEDSGTTSNLGKDEQDPEEVLTYTDWDNEEESISAQDETQPTVWVELENAINSIEGSQEYSLTNSGNSGNYTQSQSSDLLETATASLNTYSLSENNGEESGELATVDLIEPSIAIPTIEFPESFTTNNTITSTVSSAISRTGDVLFEGTDGSLTLNHTVSITNGSAYAQNVSITATSSNFTTGNNAISADNIYWKDVNFIGGTNTNVQVNNGGNFIMEGGTATLRRIAAQGGAIYITQGAVASVTRTGNGAHLSSIDTTQLVVNGEGTRLNVEGTNSIKAQTVSVSNGATLSLAASLITYAGADGKEAPQSSSIELINGATLINSTSNALELFRSGNTNATDGFNSITRTLAIGGEASNKLVGAWQINTNTAFALDISGIAANNANAGLTIHGSLNFYDATPASASLLSLVHNNFEYNKTYTLFELEDGASFQINGTTITGSDVDLLTYSYFSNLSLIVGDDSIKLSDLDSVYFTYSDGKITFSIESATETYLYWGNEYINDATRNINLGIVGSRGELVMEGGDVTINSIKAQGGSVSVSQGANLNVVRDNNTSTPAIDTKDFVIDGNSTTVTVAGSNGIKAQNITVSNGATLSIGNGFLTYNGVDANGPDEDTTLTLHNGATLESTSESTIELFRPTGSYADITRTLTISGENANTLRGDFKIDINKSFALNISDLQSDRNQAGLIIDGNLSFYDDTNTSASPNEFTIIHDHIKSFESYTLFELTDGSSLTINGQTLTGLEEYDLLSYFTGLKLQVGDKTFNLLDNNNELFSSYLSYIDGKVILKVEYQYVWDGSFTNTNFRDNTWKLDENSTWFLNSTYNGTVNTGGENVYFNDNTSSYYVDISGEVWSKNINITIEQNALETQSAYLDNYGYLFYSADRTGSITDSYHNTLTGEVIGYAEFSNLSPTQQAEYSLQATNIIKNGSGVVNLATSNSFTGNIYLNEGSIVAAAQNALGSGTIYMQDKTELFVNYEFTSDSDSAYRNPRVTNNIILSADEEGQYGTYTIGYGHLSISLLYYNKFDGPLPDTAGSSRHWRTLSLLGDIRGDGELILQGYTSHVSSKYFTSMFHIYGSEAVFDEAGNYQSGTDFKGTIKLDNFILDSPLASGGTNLDDETRGAGALQLRVSDASLQFATIDLSRRMNTVVAYDKKTYTRQTPDTILYVSADAKIAGLNADFLGSVCQAKADGRTDDYIDVTQNEEASQARVVTTLNSTLSLNSVKGVDYAFSGVVGGAGYTYSSSTEGFLNAKSTDTLSLIKLGEGSQYIYSASLHDLNIGEEPTINSDGSSGGKLGFRDLELSGGLTMTSNSTLELGVTEAQRTNEDGSTTKVKWYADDYTTNNEGAFTFVNNEYVLYNEEQHGAEAKRFDRVDRSQVIHRTDGESVIKTADSVTIKSGEHVRIYTTQADAQGKPIGSTIMGNLHMGADTALDFISTICPTLGQKELSVAQIVDLGNHAYVKAETLSAPTDGFLLTIEGRMEFNGVCNVDFSGIDFSSEMNNRTYYLAHFTEGIIGSFDKQIISLGQGYYGIIQSIETYTGVDYFTINGTNYTLANDFSFNNDGTLNLTNENLTSITVTLDGNQYEGYSFDYTWNLGDNPTVTETIKLVLGDDGQYYYSINGFTHATSITGNNAIINMSGAAYGDLDGYLVMTVTNAPPRTWFNTDNILDAKGLNVLRDKEGNVVTITDSLGDNYIIYVTTEGEHLTLAPDSTTYKVTVDGIEINVNNYGGTSNGNYWTSNSNDGTNYQDWVAMHLAFESACRVRFDELGVARYLGTDAEGNSMYSRGGQTLYHYSAGNYSMWYNGVTEQGYPIGAPVLFEIDGHQYDIVYVKEFVDPLSVFVDAGAPQKTADGTSLANGDYINYFFFGVGNIADVVVTETNRTLLQASGIEADIGTVIQTTFEKTGGGIVSINMANTYSGGTILRAGTLQLRNSTVLNDDGSIKSSPIGTGVLRSYAGSSLQLNCLDPRSNQQYILAALYNDLEVYYTGHATEDEQYALTQGSIIRNGYYYPDEEGDQNIRKYIDIVQLRGAISSESDDSVLTLVAVRGVNSPDSSSVTYWIKDLSDYTGTIRLDSYHVDENDTRMNMIGGAIVLSLAGSHAHSTTVDLSLNNSSKNTLAVQDHGNLTPSLTLDSLTGGTYESMAQMHGRSNIVADADATYATLTLTGNKTGGAYYGDLGYGYYYATLVSAGTNIRVGSVLRLVKQGDASQTVASARLDGVSLQGGRLHFINDLVLSGSLTMAAGTQLVIGQDGDIDSSTQPYSIVLQGDGTLAFRNGGTAYYTSEDGTYTASNAWSNLKFSLNKYSPDVTTNMLMTGGTIAANSNITIDLTIRFEVDDKNTAIINTSTYDYERDILAEVDISRSDSLLNNKHTISFTGKLDGFGDIGILGGGTVELRAANTFVAGADNDRTCLYVSGGTTLDLRNNNAVGTFANGAWTYSSNIDMGHYKQSGAVSTLSGKTRVFDGISAQIASVEISELSDFQILGTNNALVTNVTAKPMELAYLKNIEAGHRDNIATIKGLYDDASKNKMEKAIVSTASGSAHALKNITVEDSFIELSENVSMSLEDMFFDSKTKLYGAATELARSNATSFGSVNIESLQVQSISGDNVNRNRVLPEVYTYGNTEITYSASATTEDVKQIVYTLSNIASTQLNGVAGGLVLKFDSEFIRVEPINNETWYLGIFFENATISELANTTLSEQMVTIELEDGTSLQSIFYTSYNDGTGVTFYFLIPEPSSTTLFLISIAASCLRRRRKI